MVVVCVGLLSALITLDCYAVPAPPNARSETAPVSPPGSGAPQQVFSSGAHLDKPSLWIIHQQLLTSIRGKAVENRDGQLFGEVDDFVIDANSGEVLLAVISSGGWLGLGKKLKAVPPQLLSVATAKRGVASVDIGRRRWDRAPLFKRNDLVGLSSDSGAISAVCRYYASRATSRRDATAASRQNLSGTWRPTAQRKLFFASSFLGKDLLDEQGDDLGKVSNLLIDFDRQRPTLAIVSGSKTLNRSARFALTLRSFDAERGVLRTKAISRNFINAPSLDDKTWKSARRGQPVFIYRFPTTGNSVGRTRPERSPERKPQTSDPVENE